MLLRDVEVCVRCRGPRRPRPRAPSQGGHAVLPGGCTPYTPYPPPPPTPPGALPLCGFTPTPPHPTPGAYTPYPPYPQGQLAAALPGAPTYETPKVQYAPNGVELHSTR